jgi:tRNA(Arg) A34 adenosine deaminase TadA
MQDDFETRVRRQIERLKNCSFVALEREVAEKRVAWFKQNHAAADGRRGSSPHAAYELLFFDYMGLSEDELPVVSETETEIVWLSRNRCPTLEACQALGLDTRQVCRAAYEKSTQALVSQLDPQLRFLRSYVEIRPHAEHCREMIVRVDFESLMACAVEEARVSRQAGQPGSGAVVALGNRIIGRAHAAAVTEQDPSRHAEVTAIRQAVHTVGDVNLSGAILFSTCEPCPTCAALAVWANLTTIVYGLSIQEIGWPGTAERPASSQQSVGRSPALLEVIGGVLGDECRSLYA